MFEQTLGLCAGMGLYAGFYGIDLVLSQYCYTYILFMLQSIISG